MNEIVKRSFAWGEAHQWWMERWMNGWVDGLLNEWRRIDKILKERRRRWSIKTFASLTSIIPAIKSIILRISGTNLTFYPRRAPVVSNFTFQLSSTAAWRIENKIRLSALFAFEFLGPLASRSALNVQCGVVRRWMDGWMIRWAGEWGMRGCSVGVEKAGSQQTTRTLTASLSFYFNFLLRPI